MPAKKQIRVRMYRHGLGDCFLLTLPTKKDQPTEKDRPYYLMIDCGVILGTSDASAKMEEVVRNIIDVTGGNVDLLVATHEHWDHLSGFLQASDLFAAGDEDSPGKLHIHGLWLAWTENPSDEMANLLRGQRKKTERGLRLALQRLRAAELEAAPDDSADEDDGRWTTSQQVASLLSFFGASSRRGTAGALEAVHDYAQASPRYLTPGEPPIELVPGARVFVLGPPRHEKLIKKSSPSRRHSEVYEMAFGLTPDNAFFAAALDESAAAAGGFTELRESTQPFDRSHRIPELQAKQLPFFQRYYWGDAGHTDYADQSWRRIDAEWLGAAADLALKLDSDTNNTSLVLAIELVATGRVLLFPGDAQVGNWLSWEHVSWTLDDGRKLTGHDLLARTVLYKVGHHGSHNATLRDKGLELMNHEDLVALVPVDHEMAVKKRWAEIPFDPLLERLAEKAHGRVLRSDDAEKLKDREPPGGVPAAEWRRFQSRVEETELYYEIGVEL